MYVVAERVWQGLVEKLSLGFNLIFKGEKSKLISQGFGEGTI